jgi:hypothetical protein
MRSLSLIIYEKSSLKHPVILIISDFSLVLLVFPTLIVIRLLPSKIEVYYLLLILGFDLV